MNPNTLAVFTDLQAARTRAKVVGGVTLVVIVGMMGWRIRLIAALLLDVKPYLVNGWWRLGYGLTNVVFSTLPFIYTWGALKR